MRLQASFLGTTARMPASRAGLSSPAKGMIVNSTIGIEGSRADICLAASTPSMSGIARSIITASGLSSSNFRIPVRPSSASDTFHCRDQRTARSIRRAVCESSTIRMFNGFRANTPTPDVHRICIEPSWNPQYSVPLKLVEAARHFPDGSRPSWLTNSETIRKWKCSPFAYLSQGPGDTFTKRPGIRTHGVGLTSYNRA